MKIVDEYSGHYTFEELAGGDAFQFPGDKTLFIKGFRIDQGVCQIYRMSVADGQLFATGGEVPVIPRTDMVVTREEQP